MSKLFDAWLGAVVLEIVVLGLALLFSDQLKFVIFLATVITATLIVGSTYLLLQKDSSASKDA